MKEQFVTSDIALKLKEKGFNNICFGYYDTDGDLYLPFKLDTDEDFGYYFGKLSDDHIKAPLWQEVIDWFASEYRMEYSLSFGIDDEDGNNTVWRTFNILILDGGKLESDVLFFEEKLYVENTRELINKHIIPKMLELI